MALTVDTVVPFLLERGLVHPRDVVRDRLEVVDASRRNRNFRVKRRGAPGYLVKQANPSELATAESVAAEARFYDACHADPRLAPVLDVVPRRLGFLAEDRVLVLELLADAVPLSRVEVPGALPPELGAALGRALATVHRAFRDVHVEASPEVAPWILGIHRPPPEMLAHLSSAHWQMLHILQESDGVGAALDRLSRAARAETVIHGDLKPDNVLVTRGAEPRAYIVDWELAQRGDAAWDVGAILQDLLLFWLRSIPVSPRSVPEKLADEARFPLANLVAALRAFWDAYRSGAELGDAAGSFLERAVAASGAHLLQRVYEQATREEALTGRDVVMLQLAVNILANPGVAAPHLYGIPPIWLFSDVGRS